jgi:AraC-like DNA-binding protein
MSLSTLIVPPGAGSLALRHRGPLPDPVDADSLDAVHRVIATMRHSPGETHTMDSLARTALYSKSHLSRVFKQITGTSPGRFLGALRLEEAKTLLLGTSYSVSAIGGLVGYGSPGTFSWRFSAGVGMSPLVFRRHAGRSPRLRLDDSRLQRGGPGSTLRGSVLSDGRPPGLVHLALFQDRLPQGPPLSCTIVDDVGDFELRGIPDGHWFVLAHSALPEPRQGAGRRGNGVLVGSAEVVVRADGPPRDVGIWLRPPTAIDPPLVLALSEA